MSDNSDQVYDIISGSFELEKVNEITIEQIQKVLTARIREMLDKNLEKLLHILYRIDVSQKKTDKIFNSPFKDEIAENLAAAVIERQLEKIETRKKYSRK